MMRTVMVALTLALAACAPQETTTTPETKMGNNGAVAAPTPEGVTLHITAAQDGQSVNVGVSQRFAVELVGIPTAGYVWEPAQVPAFLTRAGEASGNTTQAQSQPGFAGGNHWEVLMFAATAPGSGDLIIEQRRPWETNEPPSATFRVTIVAQ